MAATKTSALTAAVTLVGNDLFNLSQYVSAGVYTSKKITATVVTAALGISGTPRYLTMYDPATSGGSLTATVLYQSATSNRIGINTTSPLAPLHLRGTAIIESAGTSLGITDYGHLTIAGILTEDVKIKFNLAIDQEAGLYFQTTEPTTGSFRYGGTGFRFMPSGTAQTVKFYSNGNVGFGDMIVPTYALSFSGQEAKVIGLERHTTAATAGCDLTVLAGGAKSVGSNLAGGNLYLKPGQSTGNAVSYVYIQTPTAGASGTSDTSYATRVTVGPLGLGIGVTPSYALDLSGVMNIAETGFIRIATNKYLHYTHPTLTSVTGGNTFLGYNVALSVTGAGNTGMGASALAANTSGANNTAVGAGALTSLTTASFCTAIGADAGSSTTGAGNVLVGRRAGQKNEGGSYNTFVGTDSCALYGSALTGSYNIGLGYTAGLYISGTSGFCIGIGLEAGGLVSGTSYQHSTAIGAYAKFTASKQVVIGGAGGAYVYNDFLLGTNDNPTEDTNEYDLTIRVGEAKFNSRNNMGGNNLIIKPGVSRGDGSAGIGTPKSGDFIVQTTNIGAAAGVVNTFTQRMVVKGATGYIGLQGITAPTSFLHLAAGTTAASSMRMPAGVAPSSPNDGDMYYVDTNDRLMFFKNATACEVISASAVTTETIVGDTSLTITYNGTTYKLLARA